MDNSRAGRRAHCPGRLSTTGPAAEPLLGHGGFERGDEAVGSGDSHAAVGSPAAALGSTFPGREGFGCREQPQCRTFSYLGAGPAAPGLAEPSFPPRCELLAAGPWPRWPWTSSSHGWAPSSAAGCQLVPPPASLQRPARSWQRGRTPSGCQSSRQTARIPASSFCPLAEVPSAAPVSELVSVLLSNPVNAPKVLFSFCSSY